MFDVSSPLACTAPSLGWPLSRPSAAELQDVLNVAVTGLLATVQAALPDLRRAKDAAVLVTNGGLGIIDPKSPRWRLVGVAPVSVLPTQPSMSCWLALRNAQTENVYVGQVMVLAAVKGTSWDNGCSTIEASIVTAKVLGASVRDRDLVFQGR